MRGGSIPTIDTGTGTWESHYPGSGVLEVIRTGGAFLLVKRHAFDRIAQPWFACRFPMRWLDALAEVDNLVRCNNDGLNPWIGPLWTKLLQKAANDPQSRQAVSGYEVGEDSGFCDRAKAAGLRIGVDSNVEIGHIDSRILNGGTHKERMNEQARETRQIYGILR